MSAIETPYTLLPFRFERFNDQEYLLTNEVGEYLFMSDKDFSNLSIMN